MNQNYDFNKNLAIIGCGGHAKVITEIAESIGFQNIFYIDKSSQKKYFLNREVNSILSENYNDYIFVALGDNYKREVIFKKLQNNYENSQIVSLIHPSSQVSKRCRIGIGSVVMPLSIINSSTEVGKGVIINSNTVVEHDNLIMDFSSLAPRVTTGGNVYIGARSAISIGSTIKNNVKVGSDSVIGASSYLNKDVGDNCIFYGNPAKFIRNKEIGEKYL